MHAASVHPEPGSNSRSVCINTRCKQVLFLASRTNLFLLRAFALSFLYSLLSIVSLRIFEFRISHILSFSMLCTSSLFYCSFVKDRCPLSATACILYHVLPPLSRGFSKVFSTFFHAVRLLRGIPLPLFATARIFYHLSHDLSSLFLMGIITVFFITRKILIVYFIHIPIFTHKYCIQHPANV